MRTTEPTASAEVSRAPNWVPVAVLAGLAVLVLVLTVLFGLYTSGVLGGGSETTGPAADVEPAGCSGAGCVIAGLDDTCVPAALMESPQPLMIVSAPTVALMEAIADGDETAVIPTPGASLLLQTSNEISEAQITELMDSIFSNALPEEVNKGACQVVNGAYSDPSENIRYVQCVVTDIEPGARPSFCSDTASCDSRMITAWISRTQRDALKDAGDQVYPNYCTGWEGTTPEP